MRTKSFGTRKLADDWLAAMKTNVRIDTEFLGKQIPLEFQAEEKPKNFVLRPYVCGVFGPMSTNCALRIQPLNESTTAVELARVAGQIAWEFGYKTAVLPYSAPPSSTPIDYCEPKMARSKIPADQVAAPSIDPGARGRPTKSRSRKAGAK